MDVIVMGEHTSSTAGNLRPGYGFLVEPGKDRALRHVSLAFVVVIAIAAVGQGLGSGVEVARADDERQSGFGIRGPDLPWPGRFEVQVLVGGALLPQKTVGGERRVEAVPAAEYELRLTNPLSERVAVAVSVDGLNVLDARHTTAWDAGKWVIHPYGTLSISGWQVGPERARRFYFTNEHDAYATRIGRPGDFGVISAVFYRERHPISEIIAPRTAVPERAARLGAAEPPAAGQAAQSDLRGESGSGDRLRPSWRYDGRAATGIGCSVPSEVQQVSMELERHPVAVVTLRYDFRQPYPRPLIVPGFAPEPAERGRSSRREEGRFAPVP
jgi:hypothetical protein